MYGKTFPGNPLKGLFALLFFPLNRTENRRRERKNNSGCMAFFFFLLVSFFSLQPTKHLQRPSSQLILQWVKVANIAVFMFHLDSIFWPLCGDKIAPPLSLPLFLLLKSGAFPVHNIEYRATHRLGQVKESSRKNLEYLEESLV